MAIRLPVPPSGIDKEARAYMDALIRELERALNRLDALTSVLKHKSYSAADWTSLNPLLEEGEIGFEKDTNKIKVGDGVTSWTGLGYI